MNFLKVPPLKADVQRNCFQIKENAKTVEINAGPGSGFGDRR